MNEYKLGPEGLRLIQQFEGKPRLTARRCEGNRFELSYGCTTWPDGRDIREGQTCSEDQAILLFQYHAKRFEEEVRSALGVEVDQLQFDAMVALAYNIGPENFKKSSVLSYTNSRQFENAAASFWLWNKATSPYDDKGQPWLGPDGQPCRYTRALRGLLRRRHAEACLYLGYDWDLACADDAVAIRAEKTWDAANNRWLDRINPSATTQLRDVLNVARQYPLRAGAAPTITIVTDKPRDPAPVVISTPVVEEAPRAASEDAVAKSDVGAAAVVPTGPQPTQPPSAPPSTPVAAPVAIPKQIDPNVGKLNVSQIRVENGVKPMEQSDRAMGFAIKAGGIALKVAAGRGTIPAVVATSYFEVFADPFLTTCIIGGAIWCIGWTLEKIGHKKRMKHLESATTVLT